MNCLPYSPRSIEYMNTTVTRGKNYCIKILLLILKFSYVVKSGIHYGVDYTVYRSHPSMCHSEMCVLVVDSLAQATDESSASFSWKYLSTLTRIVPDVMKILLLCFVSCSNSSSRFLASYDEVRKWTVKSVTVTTRRPSKRSDDFQNIASIQARYHRQSTLSNPRKTMNTKRKRYYLFNVNILSLMDIHERIRKKDEIIRVKESRVHESIITTTCISNNADEIRS